MFNQHLINGKSTVTNGTGHGSHEIERSHERSVWTVDADDALSDVVVVGWITARFVVDLDHVKRKGSQYHIQSQKYERNEFFGICEHIRNGFE